MLPADCFFWLAKNVAVAPVIKIGWLSAIVYKVASLPVVIKIVFLIYWLLPNSKIPPLLVFVVALFVGLAMEAMKMLIWPWLYAKMKHKCSPFDHSVAILLWSFVSIMLVLGGADWAARKAREMKPEIE